MHPYALFLRYIHKEDTIKISFIRELKEMSIMSPMKDHELENRIGTLSYEVTQNAATEAPFTGQYNHHFEKGLYVDIVSGEPLFSSLDKFDSGCGWPAFTKPLQATVTEHTDISHHMHRIEIRSKEAHSHLGHVFTDGPTEQGGLRYCINSAALKFIAYDDLEKEGYGYLRSLFSE